MQSLAGTRLPGLDTLRALAIVLVMLFHLAGTLPPCFGAVAQFGWVGVDIFFVLSGFLIGSQLLRPYAAGRRPRLWAFYQRRLYRILPAYFCVLALYFLVPAWRERPGISPLWQFLSFTENLLVDYGAHPAFSHAWSLCVEEQFYLLLPPLVLLAMRRPTPARLAGLVAGVLLLGMVTRAFALAQLRHIGPGSDDFGVFYLEHVYYPTYTRLDGLLTGVLLAAAVVFRPAQWAMWMRRRLGLQASGFCIAGVALWLFAGRFYSAFGPSAWGTVLGFPLLALGIGLVTAGSAGRPGVAARVQVPGARLLATLAFSLYLTHKEAVHLDQLFVLPHIAGGLEPRSWAAVPVYAATCLLTAAALYLAVERPFLALRKRHGWSVERSALENPAL